MTEINKQYAYQIYWQDKLDEAQRIARELLRATPDDAQLWLLDGLVCARQQRFAEALESLDLALQYQRTYKALVTLGQVYLIIGDQSRAEQYLAEAVDFKPEVSEARVTLASVYVNLGKFELAEKHFQRLIEQDQADAGVYGNLALTLEMLRRDEDARLAAGKALELDEYQPMAQLVLARLDRRSNNERASIPRLRQAIAVHGHSIDGASLLGELGHALDRAGDYDDAFNAFQAANVIWRKASESAPRGKSLILRIEELQHQFSLQTAAAADDREGAQLIFFVGFPRSGTTLVEQILKVCPNVVTTQEEPLVTNLITQLSSGKAGGLEYPALLENLTEADLVSLRQRYISELQQLTGVNNSQALYVDKLPLNIIEAGFIHMLFPKARFLVALRDPRDACLSCFMQSFQLNSAMLHFLDIGDTARFYAATMGLWNHYKSVLTDLNYLEYRYEDLVSDFDATSKRILDFLGIEWTPEIRRFHEQAGASIVRTPSFIDVASPLYARAIGRWRFYARQLASIEANLQPFIEQYGYVEGRIGSD